MPSVRVLIVDLRSPDLPVEPAAVRSECSEYSGVAVCSANCHHRFVREGPVSFHHQTVNSKLGN